jgi:hypothetical protein
VRNLERWAPDGRTQKIFSVTLLKVFYVFPEWLKEASGNCCDGYHLRLVPNNYSGQSGDIGYHTDFLYSDYKYTEEYGYEINEDMKDTVLEEEGVIQQTIWDVTVECTFPIGTSADELAHLVSWDLETYHSYFGDDLHTKILSSKFSTAFLTQCAILSEIWTNHSNDKTLAEFIECNDIGLPLAHKVHIESELDDEESDNFDYIEQTWEQLCETLGVDKEGDYTTYKEMIANK